MAAGSRLIKHPVISNAVRMARIMSLKKLVGLAAFASWTLLTSVSLPAYAGDIIRTKNDASRCDVAFRKGRLAVDCPYQMTGVMFLKITRATNIEFSIPSKIAKTRASVALPEMPLREAVVRLLEPYNFVWTEHDSQETPFPAVAILGTKQSTADGADFDRRWNNPVEASELRGTTPMEMEEPSQPRIGRQARSRPTPSSTDPAPDSQRSNESEAEGAGAGLSFSSLPSNPGPNGGIAPSPTRETSIPPEARDNPNSSAPPMDPSLVEEHPLPATAQN